jgi:hypothetical protein
LVPRRFAGVGLPNWSSVSYVEGVPSLSIRSESFFVWREVMTLMGAPDNIRTLAADEDVWPAEVDLIISALAAGEDRAKAARSPGLRRREVPRTSYRVLADLRLYSDTHDADAWRLYTRDVSVRGLGFITPHRLPLGYGGTIELPAPDGRIIAVNCTLLRCREIASGWFDGALYFNREQAVFAIK